MLTAIQSRLDDFCFVLASASPRRLQLLKELAGFKDRLKVLPSKFSENLDQKSYSSPAEYAIATSLEKAVDVASNIPSISDRHVIISADTVVECDGQILEKPRDYEHSRAMLRSLSGRVHLVHTGVTLGFFDASLPHNYKGLAQVKPVPLKNDSRCLNTLTFSVTTRVRFCNLSDEVIAGYVSTGEGLDKAGSYGIQGFGSTLVESIDGDFYNVVGLPLTRLCQELYAILRNK